MSAKISFWSVCHALLPFNFFVPSQNAKLLLYQFDPQVHLEKKPVNMVKALIETYPNATTFAASTTLS